MNTSNIIETIIKSALALEFFTVAAIAYKQTPEGVDTGVRIMTSLFTGAATAMGTLIPGTITAKLTRKRPEATGPLILTAAIYGGFESYTITSQAFHGEHESPAPIIHSTTEEENKHYDTPPPDIIEAPPLSPK